jgi:hypothetical protein
VCVSVCVCVCVCVREREMLNVDFLAVHVLHHWQGQQQLVLCVIMI